MKVTTAISYDFFFFMFLLSIDISVLAANKGSSYQTKIRKKKIVKPESSSSRFILIHI
jgi:hypothetical protein